MTAGAVFNLYLEAGYSRIYQNLHKKIDIPHARIRKRVKSRIYLFVAFSCQTQEFLPILKILSPFASSHLFKFHRNLPISQIFYKVFFSEVLKGHIFGQTRASHATPEMINFFSQNAPKSKSVISEDKSIIAKAYSM